MHIASCSKLITAIAMTKLLNDKHMSYDTPIIAFLPSYWAKGANIDKITFRHLMTHTSGLGINDRSDSDFKFMQAGIAAGATRIGSYLYQNMNFGLCRILLSTVNGNIAQFPLSQTQTICFGITSRFRLTCSMSGITCSYQRACRDQHSIILRTTRSLTVSQSKLPVGILATFPL